MQKPQAQLAESDGALRAIERARLKHVSINHESDDPEKGCFRTGFFVCRFFATLTEAVTGIHYVSGYYYSRCPVKGTRMNFRQPKVCTPLRANLMLQLLSIPASSFLPSQFLAVVCGSGADEVNANTLQKQQINTITNAT